MKINPVAMDILWHPDSPLNAVSYSKETEQLREMTDSKYKIGNIQGEQLVRPVSRKQKANVWGPSVSEMRPFRIASIILVSFIPSLLLSIRSFDIC